MPLQACILFCCLAFLFTTAAGGIPWLSDLDTDVAIIGAGPSGLYSAWRLATSTTKKIHLFEATNRVGGRFWTRQLDPDVCPEALAELVRVFFQLFRLSFCLGFAVFSRS